MTVPTVGNNTSSTDPEDPSSQTRYNFYRKNGNSSGLSGGAIAAIILVCCAAVIAIGVLIALVKSGKILNTKRDELEDFNNSSTNAAVYNP